MEELNCLKESGSLPRNSTIRSLSPVLDNNGVLRVGGWLNEMKDSDMSVQQRNLIILPKNNNITSLIISHFHLRVVHQGRHFTEGALHATGYWVVGL
jgi:hypothetical protein